MVQVKIHCERCGDFIGTNDTLSPTLYFKPYICFKCISQCDIIFCSDCESLVWVGKDWKAQCYTHWCPKCLQKRLNAEQNRHI